MADLRPVVSPQNGIFVLCHLFQQNAKEQLIIKGSIVANLFWESFCGYLSLCKVRISKFSKWQYGSSTSQSCLALLDRYGGLTNRGEAYYCAAAMLQVSICPSLPMSETYMPTRPTITPKVARVSWRADARCRHPSMSTLEGLGLSSG